MVKLGAIGSQFLCKKRQAASWASASNFTMSSITGYLWLRPCSNQNSIYQIVKSDCNSKFKSICEVVVFGEEVQNDARFNDAYVFSHYNKLM